jgi:NAD(P)-dependent dehydrogenase (short-subunit alcohol dehydrogenase family)
MLQHPGELQDAEHRALRTEVVHQAGRREGWHDGGVAADRARWVLVTGASTGIGAETVSALVAIGTRVWAGVRREEDAERLVREYGHRVQVLRFDVTDDEAVAAAGERIVAAGPLDGVVCNAGIALPGPLEFLPVTALREQLEVNLIGQLRVIQAVLPAVRSGSGRVVVVGSMGGRIAAPMLGAYHASKFALVGLTDSLRAELAPWRIPVILVEPGVVATPIWTRGTANGDRLGAQMPARAQELYGAQIARVRAHAERAVRRGLPPQEVAAVIVRALTVPRPRPRYLVGRDALLGSFVARLPFRVTYRLTAARSR